MSRLAALVVMTVTNGAELAPRFCRLELWPWRASLAARDCSSWGGKCVIPAAAAVAARSAALPTSSLFTFANLETRNVSPDFVKLAIRILPLVCSQGFVIWYVYEVTSQQRNFPHVFCVLSVLVVIDCSDIWSLHIYLPSRLAVWSLTDSLGSKRFDRTDATAAAFERNSRKSCWWGARTVSSHVLL